MNILLAIKHQQLAQHQAAVLVEILKDVANEEPEQKISGRTAPGDERKLRGIPCIADGVGGTSPGTDPLRAALRKERQRLIHD